MKKYFGTDGIRGVVGKDLTTELAFKCGLALCKEIKKPTVIIGGDTRTSRDMLVSAVSSGVMQGGGKVIDVGVCPTPAIAFLTKEVGADYGVVISASHNPPKFNGIKIFDRNGQKLDDSKEEKLEKIIDSEMEPILSCGSYKNGRGLKRKYIEHLVGSCHSSLKGLKVALDCSNGASGRIAPHVFKMLGAEVFSTSTSRNGEKINEKCGSTNPQNLSAFVKKMNADVGFAFDGDADRIIACDENGKIIDGDIIIFMLAKYFKKTTGLKNNTVVGTTHTNTGIEKALKKFDVNLIRAEVGDKYVIEKMEEKGLNLGGEKSGHVILKDYATTGDGVLTAVKISEMIMVLGKKLSKLAKVRLYLECNLNVDILDKQKVMASNELQDALKEIKNSARGHTKIIVRPSGTEPKIRIMVESNKKNVCEDIASKIYKVIKEIDGE